MNLDVFIKEALISIVSGIVNAQKDVEGKNVFINPLGVKYNDIKCEGIALNGHRTSTVEFDLSVTVQEANNLSGVAGVKTGIINISVGGDSASINNSVSRMKFSVPILFPVQEFIS